MKDRTRVWVGIVLGILLSIAGFYVFLTLVDTKDVSVPQGFLTERERKMKLGQFKNLTGTNDDLEDLQNFHNLGYYDGEYYWAEVSGDNLLIKKSTLTGSTSTENTYDMSPASGSNTYTDVVLRIVYIGSKWYVCAIVGALNNFGGGLYKYFIYESFYNLSDGGSYVDDNYQTGSGPLTEEIYIMEIFSYGSQIDFIYYQIDATGTTGILAQLQVNITSGLITATGSFSDITYLTNDESIYAGYYDGTNFNFVVQDGATGNDILYSVPSGGTEVKTTLTGLTLALSNNSVQLYWKQGNTELIIDEDHLYTRVNGGEWRSYSDTGTTTNAVIWNYKSDGTLFIEFIVWKDSIYKVLDSGALLKIQTTTADAYVGWEDWFCNGADTIYQLGAYFEKDGTSIYPHETSFFDYHYPNLPYGEFHVEDNTPWNTGDGILLYSRTDDLYHIMIVGSLNTPENSGLYIIPLQSVASRDWTRKLDASFDYRGTATDTPDIIVDILAICEYIGTGTISTTPSTTRTLNFDGYEVGQALLELDNIENYRHRVTPMINLDWDDGLTTQDLDYKKRTRGVVQWGTAASPSLGDWTENLDTFEVVNKNNNLNMIRCVGDSGEYAFISYTTQDDEFIEFKIILAQTNKDVVVYIAESNRGNYICRLLFESDGNVDFQGTALDADIQAYVAETEYIVKISFIKSGNCKLYIDDTEISTVTGNAYDFTHIHFVSGNADTEWWFDTLGLSWDGYTAGDNQKAGVIIKRDMCDQINELDLIAQPSSITVHGSNVNGTRIVKVGESTDRVEPNNWNLHLPCLTDDTETQAVADSLVADLDQSNKRYVVRTFSRFFRVNEQSWFESIKPSVTAALFTLEGKRSWPMQYIEQLTYVETPYPWNARQQTTQTNNVLIQSAEDRIEKNTKALNIIAADDTTPDVSAGSDFETSANTGATAITDLDNPNVGSTITIFGGSDTNSSTIADAAPFYLNGAMTLGYRDSIVLYIYSTTEFREKSRTTV